MWQYKWKVGLSPTKQFQILRTMWTLCELYVISRNSAHCVNTNFFLYCAKVHFNRLFLFLWPGNSHVILDFQYPTETSPNLQREPNAYGIPIKNECWFLHTNIDSRATPTLAWKGETGTKKQFFWKNRKALPSLYWETKDFGQKKRKKKFHPICKENPMHTVFPLKMNVDFFTRTLILEPHRH